MNNPTESQTIRRFEPTLVASVDNALTLLFAASMVGVEIAKSFPLEQLTQIASAVGQEEVCRQWILADIAHGHVARSPHPADVAQSLGVPVKEVINSVTTSNHWPMAERKEGGPLHLSVPLWHRLTLTVKEASALTGIERAKLDRAVRFQQLKPLQLEGANRILRSELDRYLATLNGNEEAQK